MTNLDEVGFRHILLELIDDNALSCAGVLSLAALEFTAQIPTLEVSVGDRVTLRVNLNFIRRWAQSNAHVQALILHEFLHVVLNHTGYLGMVTETKNLAADAVINNIIRRKFPESVYSFFGHYYGKPLPPYSFLVPLSEEEHQELRASPKRDWAQEIRLNLLEGRLLAEDIEEIALEIPNRDSLYKMPPGRLFIGSHPTVGSKRYGDTSAEILDNPLRSFDTQGLLRNTLWERRIPVEKRSRRLPDPVEIWREKTLKLLKHFATPNPNVPAHNTALTDALLPLLSPADKRAFLKQMWCPFVPEAAHVISTTGQRDSCQIYLDVSGSMDVELNELVSLLHYLRHEIQRPFWAFSTHVVPAKFVAGRLETYSTGGTYIDSVFRHILNTRPGKAVVVTDGRFRNVTPADRETLLRAKQSVAFLVTSRGDDASLKGSTFEVKVLDPHPLTRRSQYRRPHQA